MGLCRKFTAILFVAFALTASVSADPLFLIMPIEGRGMGIANANVSYARGTGAVRYNPAGLGFAVGPEAEVTHVLIGQELTADSAMVTYPFAEFFSIGIFASALYLNTPFKKVEDFQETNIDLTLFDSELGVASGYRMTDNLSVGFNLRYFRFQLGPEISQSFGSDVGVMYEFKMPWEKQGYNKWATGLAIKNIGPAYNFFGGGVQEGQPIKMQTGLSYKGNKWVLPSFDVAYSKLEEMSFHLGLDIMPQFYVSPKVGITKDIYGLSFSVGGGFGYGNNLRLNAIGGTTMGSSDSGSQNTFVSLLFQKRDFESKPQVKPLDTTENITIDRMDNLYKPVTLVPFQSGFRAEKVQGILLSVESATGYKQRKMKLKRVAVQPEDEKYLKRMAQKKETELYLSERRMSLWLNFKEGALDDQVGWWDSFASVVEGGGQMEVLTGKDLTHLNSNPNAPLRVEWRLDVIYRTKAGAGGGEIKTTLTELYSGELIIAKNFPLYEEDFPFQVWQDVAQFYADYFANVKGFYKYQTVPAGGKDL